ncbi:hypothetical protein [Parasulfitobacter algicola]|uniref:Uncharacterized protein n=1 Tax=Parasulfitobacter algicola TaxID=2614809 RepID=A0ABX2IXW6_9RHOB|nr:hypothetical protein [Sulfitobacter algicola]NSX56095.1 hypothetical protein [Sulfitobacter algicola]
MTSIRPTILAMALMTCTAQSALALDECLVGEWSADLNDMTEMMAQGGMPIDGGEVTGSGPVMDISADGSVLSNMEGMTISMDMDGMNVSVTMAGKNEATIETEGDTFTITATTFDVVTEVNMNGQVSVVPPRPSELGPEISTGTYTCSETDLIFMQPPQVYQMQAIPRRWTRVAG